MDPLRLLTAQTGFFTRREAVAVGYADRDIARSVRLGMLRRLRRGAYVFADEWAGLDAVGQHLVRARAVLRSIGDDVVLSHVSGAAAHGIDLWGAPLGRVHVTRLDKDPGRVEGDVVHHVGAYTEADVVTVNGLRTLRPDVCVLGAALALGDEAALCLLESGMRAKATTKEQLTSTFAQMRRWHGAHRLAPTVALADTRSGSVGESRGRHLFRIGGIPQPDLQVVVRRPDGTIAGIPDWYWHGRRMFGEFDGKVKYGALLGPGQDATDVVFEEKRREDEIRELTGCGFVRLTWVDYDTPAVTIDRLRSVLRLAS